MFLMGAENMSQFVAVAVMLYGPFLWCHARKEAYEQYGLVPRCSRRMCGEVALVCVMTLAPLTVIALHWPGQDLPRHVAFSAFLAQFAAGSMAAITEEIFFRGWLQTLFIPFLSRTTRVVTVAALFALSHMLFRPDPFFLTTFFPGLIMGALRERHGNIFPGMLFHGLGNLWSIWFFPLP